MTGSTTSVQWPRDGSALYYALLWIAADTRQQVLERLSLVDALLDTFADAREPAVVQSKLHWWHEELDRLHAGSATHPATQANQPALVGNRDAMESCLQLVGTAADWRLRTPESAAAAETSLTRAGSETLKLVIGALDPERQRKMHEESSAQLFGAALARFQRLRRLPYALHRGIQLYADDEFAAFDIAREDAQSAIRIATAADDRNASPATRADNDRSQALAAFIANDVCVTARAFEQVLANRDLVEHFNREPLLPLWRFAAIRLRQLRDWENATPNLLREYRSLTPLAKFVIAWRHRRPGRRVRGLSQQAP